jgi:hypothetical protein
VRKLRSLSRCLAWPPPTLSDSLRSHFHLYKALLLSQVARLARLASQHLYSNLLEKNSLVLQQHFSAGISTTTAMFPSTPPAAKLSRTRLKALATWVRDELDLLVAREGPNILQPDDVLLLHETFIALRHAADITALDLRATGIHRVVQDIAGVATRWPGRLCDDCDKIILIWTTRFGPLGELRPFLYGRGGRLEGIASVHEDSREVSLSSFPFSCKTDRCR